MKTIRILALLTVFLGVQIVKAQENTDDQMKILFPKTEKKGQTANGGYGSFSIGYTNMNDQGAILIGGRGAWIANHHFSLGLAGYGFYSNLENSDNYYENPSEYSITGGYGGLLFEPIVAPFSPVHVSFPMIFGAGGATAANWEYYNYNYGYDNYYYNGDWFLVFEPGVDVEFNLTKFFRVALGVSYRLASDINLQYKYFDDANVEQTINIPENVLNGFNYNLCFKFGWF